METDKINDTIKSFRDKLSQDLIESAITNNEINFKINNEELRVRKPTFGEKQELYKAKAEKFCEYLKDDTLMMKDVLKEAFKKKGIDIDVLEAKVVQLEKRKNDTQLKLGELLAKQGIVSEIEELKNSIMIIEGQQTEITVNVNQYLEFCIEQQLYLFCYSYLIMLITEVKREDKWVRYWKSYEDFQNTQETIINTIALFASLVIKDEVKV